MQKLKKKKNQYPIHSFNAKTEEQLDQNIVYPMSCAGGLKKKK